MPQFVIAYDIREDHRREKIARVLLRYGERIQQSVFVAFLDASEHGELRRELGAILRKSDALELFPIDGRSAELHVAWHSEPHSTSPVRIVT